MPVGRRRALRPGAGLLVLGWAMLACPPARALPPHADPLLSPWTVEHVLRGELALAEGRPLEAARAFREAEAGPVPSPWITARRIEALVAAGRLQAARRALADALARWPRPAAALLAAEARLALARGDKTAARTAALQAARELPPRAGPLLQDVLEVLRATGAENTADELLARALGGPTPTILRRLRTDGPADAWDAWQRVGDTLPPWLRRRLAAALLERGHPLLALWTLGATRPQDLDPTLRLHVLLATGRFAEARALSSATPPHRLGGPEHVAAAWRSVGAPEEAAALLEEAFARDPRPELALRCARVHLLAGASREASRWLRRAADMGATLPATPVLDVLGLTASRTSSAVDATPLLAQ